MDLTATVFSSLPEFLMVCLLLALAEAVYVLFGFGAGLIAVGTLALLLPSLQDVVVLILLVNLPAELWIVLRSRHLVDWRGALTISVGILVGVPLGAWALSRGDQRLVMIGLGWFLLLAGLALLLARESRRILWPPWTGPSVGILAGLLGGMFGTAGPPLILYFRLGGLTKAAFRGSLMAIFLLLTFVRLPAYLAAGLLTSPRLLSGLMVLPAVLIGAWIGHRVHLEISEGAFGRLVSLLLSVLGLLLLLRG